MELKDIRLAVVFKDFAAWLRVSCPGLHVAGYNTEKVLELHGVDTTVFPVRHNVDIVNAILKYNGTHPTPLTHVVISAPWVATWDLKAMIEGFPATQFVVLCHSNVGFLMSDPRGVDLLRQAMALSLTHTNLAVGGNCEKFVRWLRLAYGYDAVLLPNLYPLEGRVIKDPDAIPKWQTIGKIKIGSFGAIRPYKNHITAAAAAIIISKLMGLPVEFHMHKGGDTFILSAIDQMCKNIPGFSVVRHGWEYWDDFIKVVEEMDLMIQVSYTESFNLVTADGVYAGVPSVVSSAIDWAPKHWRADADNVVSVAERGMKLLLETPNDDGVAAIERHNRQGVREWLGFLAGE